MPADDTSLCDNKINKIIIRKPNRKQSCPITAVNSKKYEPRVDSLISRKTTQENGINSSERETSSSSSHDWLKPGLSLPKFRGKDDILREVRESIRREREIGSGEASSSAVLPKESIIIEKKIDADDERSGKPSNDFFPAVEMTRPNVKILERQRRSIDGFSECPSNIHYYSSGIDFSGINENESLNKKQEDSPPLKNWRLWMRRRKQQHEVLCQKTKREPPELVMNRTARNFRNPYVRVESIKPMIAQQIDYFILTSEKKSKPQQLRILNSYASKPLKQLQQVLQFKKVCKNTHLTEERANKGEKCAADSQELGTSSMKKKVLGHSISGLLRANGSWVVEDKTLNQPSRIPEPDKWRDSPSYWKSGDRLYHKTMPEECIRSESGDDKEMASEMEFPEISNGPSIPSILIEEETEAPYHSVISDKVFQCCYPRVDVDRESTVCLAINNTELKCVYYARTSELFMANTDISEWSLIFETSPVGTLQTKALNIENRGTMAIRYHWRFKKPFSNPIKYPKLGRDCHAPWFYFDKNPGIFLPGQKYDFNFYHFSHTPGLHIETWVLETVPLLFNPPTEIKIVLAAISDHNYSMDDLFKIESYVNKCKEETLAKQIVDEMIERVFITPGLEIDYESFFLEEELFRHQNPRHHYHSEIVEELKQIYSEIPLDPPRKWDFNLLNLRGLVELKMEGELKRPRICRVNELSMALLKPSYVSHKPEGKYHLVYSLLSKVANAIERDAISLKDSLPDIPYRLKEISASKVNLKSDEIDEVEELEVQKKSSGAQDVDLDQIKLANYHQCLYIQVYHQLCLAVEQVASIIESSKLFDHHGEIGLHLFDEEEQGVSEKLLIHCMPNRSSASPTLNETSLRTSSTLKEKSLKTSSTLKEKSSRSTQ